MILPTYSPPAACWHLLSPALQEEIAEFVRIPVALPFEIVIGWSDAAGVVGCTVRTLRKAVEIGRLPRYRDPRGPRRQPAVWPLSILLEYRRWRERVPGVYDFRLFPEKEKERSAPREDGARQID